jgi:hypothetical protein
VSDRRCSGVKPNGEPCGAVIVQSNGWCPAHDPSREEARKRAAARANEAGRDPELREIRDGLARLMEKADRADADLERVDALVRIARARLRYQGGLRDRAPRSRNPRAGGRIRPAAGRLRGAARRQGRARHNGRR